jgi:hypothetical protein
VFAVHRGSCGSGGRLWHVHGACLRGAHLARNGPPLTRHRNGCNPAESVCCSTGAKQQVKNKQIQFFPGELALSPADAWVAAGRAPARLAGREGNGRQSRTAGRFSSFQVWIHADPAVWAAACPSPPGLLETARAAGNLQRETLPAAAAPPAASTGAPASAYLLHVPQRRRGPLHLLPPAGVCVASPDDMASVRGFVWTMTSPNLKVGYSKTFNTSWAIKLKSTWTNSVDFCVDIPGAEGGAGSDARPGTL